MAEQSVICRRPWLVIGTALALSFASLFLSYYVFGSEAYRAIWGHALYYKEISSAAQFQSWYLKGPVIHFGRSALLLFFLFHVLCRRFQEKAETLLTSRFDPFGFIHIEWPVLTIKPFAWNKQWFQTKPPDALQSTHLLALVYAIGSLVWLLIHHLSYGPHLLYLRWQAVSSVLALGSVPEPGTWGYWHEFVVPYLWYLPYSIINFVLIETCAVCVCVYAGMSDNNAIKQLLSSIRIIGEQDAEVNVGTASQKFLEFIVDFAVIIRKYRWIMFAISVIIGYELIFGHQMLTFAGVWLTVSAYIVAVAGVSYAIAMYINYDKIYTKVADKLERSKDSEGIEFSKQFSFGKVLELARTRDWYIEWCTFIFLVVIPVAYSFIIK